MEEAKVEVATKEEVEEPVSEVERTELQDRVREDSQKEASKD